MEWRACRWPPPVCNGIRNTEESSYSGCNEFSGDFTLMCEYCKPIVLSPHSECRSNQTKYRYQHWKLTNRAMKDIGPIMRLMYTKSTSPKGKSGAACSRREANIHPEA